MGWFLFLFLSFLLFPFHSYTSSLMPLRNHDEASALLRFKNSFSLNSSSYYSQYCVKYIHSSYPKTASWENGTNCCLWDGVTCDTKSGHVIGLDLSCSWLQGKFHPNSTLFQLTHLQTLNLAFNEFLGSPLFSGFGDLVTLTHLNLSYCGFDGVISSKISHLSKLVSLDLSHSYGMKFEPSTLEKLIVNATDLRELALNGINMTFIKPSSLSLLVNFSSSLVSLGLRNTELQGKLANNILCLPNLQNLDLSRNENLKGELPKFNWSTSLRYLDLSSTALSGKVSNSISHLKSLNHLGFSDSNFEGPILLSLSNLTQLTYLNLRASKLSGEIPLSLSNLQNLTDFDLSYNNFEGPIPLFLGNITQLEYFYLEGNNFSGEIPSSFSNLRHLTYLYLSANNLSGLIPDLFGKLSKLEDLDLSGNNLVGQLPSTLFDLTQLYSLRCSYNKLVGPIPEKISRLSSLDTLDLSNNFLNGTIPRWCYSLSSLLKLSLDGNQLTGPIGEFSAYSLEYCYLSYNKLQGNIPKSMFDLLNLTDLTLSSNNLSGSVDFHKFSKLQYLLTLDLSDNNFLSLSFNSRDDYTFPNLEELLLSSCNINSFPKFLTRLKNLQYLDLSYNQIHGRISKLFNNTGKDTLSYVDLSHNLLTSVGYLSLSWKNIDYIDLSFNMLEGDIPIPPFGAAFFSVSNNKLTGDISSAICNASSLNILNLSHNNLTGKLPQCLGTFPNLSVLDLQMNNLSGVIPRTYFEKNVLETINFNGNQLKGPLPRSMAKCKQLEVLDLGENNIEGAFPSWLESLQELQVLVLRANKFNGTITCLKAKHTFPKLRIFDVSNNNFSGTLPTAYIKNFKGMMNVNDGLQYMHHLEYSFYRYNYNDSVVVTIKGNNIELERILTTLTSIDLSNNIFEGEIPAIIGELKSLKGLNLSHNRITGFIPQSFGTLENLEWLDLSSNKLMGEIPKTLTNLSFLSLLNLSQNQLEGIIPTGRQFNTFQNDSYMGNPGLCGLPLSKPCKRDEEQPRDSATVHHEEKLGFGWKAVAVGYACGVVFGMLLGSIVLLIGKPQWLIKLVEDVPNQRVRKKSYKADANRRGKN